jgi:hypothetical protein
MKTVTHVIWSCAQHSIRYGRPSDMNPSFQPMSICSFSGVLVWFGV